MRETNSKVYYGDNEGSSIQKIKHYLDALNKLSPKGRSINYPYRETKQGLEIPNQSYFVLPERNREAVLHAVRNKVVKKGPNVVVVSRLSKAELDVLKANKIKLFKNHYGIGYNSHLTKPPDPPPPPNGQSVNLYQLVLPSCLVHQPNLEINNCQELVIAVLDSGIDTFYFSQKFSNYFPNLRVDEEKAHGDQSLYQYLYWDGEVAGYNTIGDNPNVYYQPDFLDDHGHGTAIAKIIKNILRAEVAKACFRILPIKVLDYNLVTTESAVVEGLYLAAKHQAKIINCSFGLPQPVEAIEEFIRSHKNTLIVASMGNAEKNVDLPEPGYGNYPSNYAATYPNVFEVMALSAYQHYHLFRDNHSPAPFANYSLLRTVYGGPGMEVPGMNPSYCLGVLATDYLPGPAERFVNYPPYPGFDQRRPLYTYLDGSSMSAAYMTGVIATFLATACQEKINDWSAEEIHDALRSPDNYVPHTMEFDDYGVVKYYFNPQLERP